MNTRIQYKIFRREKVNLNFYYPITVTILMSWKFYIVTSFISFIYYQNLHKTQIIIRMYKLPKNCYRSSNELNEFSIKDKTKSSHIIEWYAYQTMSHISKQSFIQKMKCYSIIGNCTSA